MVALSQALHPQQRVWLGLHAALRPQILFQMAKDEVESPALLREAS